MWKQGKKAITLLLAAAMLSSVFSGCTNGEDTSNPENASGDSTTSAETSSVTTLTIGVKSDPLIENYDTNYLTLMLEEANNVDVEFYQFPADADNAKSKLSLMVSSNSELPDVLNFEGLDDTTVMEYGSKGIFMPLEDYLNNPDLAKNFSQIGEEDREFMLANTESPDGHIYALSEYCPWAWNQGPYRMWVNENWLETLNLSMPETIDDFYNVLKAFVNEDPNGNGTNDEIGYVGAKDGWALDVIPFVMNAYIYTNPNKNYLYVENGNIIPAYTQDQWKQGLEFLNKLVNEGLLSPLSFTQDQNQLKALIQKEGGVAGFVPSGSYSVFSAGTALEFDEMALVPPFTGSDGACYATYNPDLPVKVWYITKDCEDVEKAFIVGDWFYDQTVSMVSRFGEKGVEWDNDPEECKLWANIFVDDGIETTFYSTNPAFWGNLQNKNWCDRNPKYRREEEMMGEGGILFSEIPEEGEPLTQPPNFTKEFFEYYVPCFPEEYISQLVYTTEETNQIAVASADILNYVKEMSAAFITGNRPLSDWDAYLAELDAMGLENYIKVTQDAFDRTK